MKARLRFGPGWARRPALTSGDLLILAAIGSLLYVGARLAFDAPRSIAGPEISTSPRALPWYAALSLGRMTVAYFLSLLFSLLYGYAAARRAGARRVLMPLLDVLQSVPILSFLPVVLLGLSAVLPQGLASEIAAVVLIFTSQAWNMTFSFYQSLSTLPVELREAAAIFRLSPWLTLTRLELPFAALGLIWNSIMSWAGGWFFLMASETFRVGRHDFRLPGLGSYLQTAASEGNARAVVLGVATLVVLVVVLDQCVWRPMLAWADKFKVETVEGEETPASWFRDLMARSWLVQRAGAALWRPAFEALDLRFASPRGGTAGGEPADEPRRRRWAVRVAATVFAILLVYTTARAAGMLRDVSLDEWRRIGIGLVATLLRVAAALALALAWTLPAGVVIGTDRRLARVLQPVSQILAAVPATALFPVVLLFLLGAPGGLNIAAVLLMLMGTQWYILFNVIAGAAAIPQDLRYTAELLRLGPLQRWRTLILPSIFPYAVTGAITAGGGAWNASIVAEYVEFAGATHSTTGIGAVIAQATAAADYPMLLAGTLVLVGSVVLVNRLFWMRLYRLAEERYRME